jgi:hypothetical protein
MKTKLCPKCKDQKIPVNFPGGICLKCSLDLPQESTLTYDVHDLVNLLHTSEEQIRRMARAGKLPHRMPGIRRYLWMKAVIDKFMDEGQPIPRIPTSPMQEEARGRCKLKDHEWLQDDKYDGIAYVTDENTHHLQIVGHANRVGYYRTCYFCGYSKFIQIY